MYLQYMTLLDVHALTVCNTLTPSCDYTLRKLETKLLRVVLLSLLSRNMSVQL